MKMCGHHQGHSVASVSLFGHASVWSLKIAYRILGQIYVTRQQVALAPLILASTYWSLILGNYLFSFLPSSGQIALVSPPETWHNGINLDSI